MLELAPGDANTYNNLAWFYATGPMDSRSPEKALPLALKTVELGKSNYAALNTLGVVYYRLGQFTNAITTLETGIKSDGAVGGSAHDFFFLAMSHQRLGDASRAEEYFDKALKWLQDQGSASEGDAELRAFRAEAEQVLGKAKPK